MQHGFRERWMGRLKGSCTFLPHVTRLNFSAAGCLACLALAPQDRHACYMCINMCNLGSLLPHSYALAVQAHMLAGGHTPDASAKRFSSPHPLFCFRMPETGGEQ